MIFIDIALVAVAIALIVAGVTAVSANKAQKRALNAAPDKKLAKAMRLLDRVVQADDVLPSLPSELRDDVKRCVHEYYAERD